VNKTGKSKTKSKSKGKLSPKAEITTAEASKVQKPTKGKPAETMDRAALRSIVSQLKSAGGDIKVFKSDTDDVLQRRVNDAIQALPSDEVLARLEAVDPVKLVAVAKRDCLGIFVDFRDISCVRCPDAVKCASTFIANLRSGFRDLPDSVRSPLVATKEEAPEKKPGILKYDPKALVFVRDVKNPNPKGDEYHDAFQRILDEQPETMVEVKKILEEDFDFDDDSDFMKFIAALRDPKQGLIKLVTDLTDKDRAVLRDAGYSI